MSIQACPFSQDSVLGGNSGINSAARFFVDALCRGGKPQRGRRIVLNIDHIITSSKKPTKRIGAITKIQILVALIVAITAMPDDESDKEEYKEFLQGCAKRCRKMNFNAQLVGALYLTSPTRYPTGPNRVDACPFSWSDHCSQMTAAEFKKRYRLTTYAFDELLAKVRPDLTAQDLKQARCSKGECDRYSPSFPSAAY